MSSESECVRRNTLYLAVRTRVVLISRSWVGTHGSGTLRLRDASSKRRIVKRKHRTRESSYKRAMLPENSYGDSTYHGHIVIASKYRARNNQLQKLRKMMFLHTVPKIRVMFSHKWNCTASFPIRTLMYLWGIYKFPGAVCPYLAASK